VLSETALASDGVQQQQQQAELMVGSRVRQDESTTSAVSEHVSTVSEAMSGGVREMSLKQLPSTPAAAPADTDGRHHCSWRPPARPTDRPTSHYALIIARRARAPVLQLCQESVNKRQNGRRRQHRAAHTH